MFTAVSDFKKTYDMLDELQTGEMWLYVANTLKAFVKELMNKGIDVYGRKYKPYSASYAKQRAKNNLTNRVNLQFTSTMYLSITARVTKDSMVIFLAGAHNQMKGKYVAEDRPFLEVAPLLVKALEQKINEYFRLRGWE